MEDDKQNDRPQHDEEDDEEEGGEHLEVLMHAAYADDGAAFMEASAEDDVASMEQRACFHCTECDVTLANLRNFIKHQQSRKHRSKVDQSKMDARKAASSSEHHWLRLRCPFTCRGTYSTFTA